MAELSRGRALFLLLMMVLCLPGCPGDPDELEDAGEVEDASCEDDGGCDAGPDVDAWLEVDGGPPWDGAVDDAGEDAGLDAGDAGEPTDDAEVPHAGLEPDAGMADAGVEPALVTELVEAGVLTPSPGGGFEPWAREIVVTAAALSEHGIDVRHLRQFRTAAERQADLVEQAVAPWRGQRNASSRARAATMAAELGELCARMHTALVRSSVADLLP